MLRPCARLRKVTEQRLHSFGHSTGAKFLEKLSSNGQSLSVPASRYQIQIRGEAERIGGLAV